MAIPLRYNIRSLLVRRVSTLMTGGGIALVVAAFVIVMALVAGLNATISDTGSRENIIVMRKGATTETESSLNLAQFDALKFLPQVRRDAAGNPYASPELPVQALLARKAGGRDNVVLRGVLPVALMVHEQVRIVAGRMFNPSLDEVIVGRGLVGSYRHCALGSTLYIGRGAWKVVGIFSAGGSSFESEVWAGVHKVQELTQRGTYYANVRLKLRPGADVAALTRRIADDPRINLEAEPEPDYYADQATVANQMRALGMTVALIMAIGAIFAAMNTMYAAVSTRTSEIGTLRALGFSPGAIMGCFLVEASLLALAAGVIGILISLPIDGLSTTFGNFRTFSTLAFRFRVSWKIVIQSMAFAALMGLLGGWLPARQAMKLSVVDALRSL
jgi:putative ABC transport system permease protein